MLEKFDTIEEAEAHLVKRKEEAYKRLKESGQTILADDSYVGLDLVNTDKYTTFLLITTKEMIEDLKNLKPFDVEQELKDLGL